MHRCTGSGGVTIPGGAREQWGCGTEDVVSGHGGLSWGWNLELFFSLNDSMKCPAGYRGLCVEMRLENTKLRQKKKTKQKPTEDGRCATKKRRREKHIEETLLM